MVALILIVSTLASSGCARYVYVQQRFPVISLPDRPQLQNLPGTEMQKMGPDTQKAVVQNFDALILYIKQVEASVKVYNDMAEETNKKSGYNF